MLVRTRFAAMFAAAAFAPHLHAEEADYYVYYGISFSPDQFASTTITRDAADGPALTRPADACGARFEYPSDADWLIPYFDDEDTRTSGHINVWLPSADCSAWTNVVIEPDDQDNNDITAPPHSVPGTLRVTDAQLYWIDTTGKKLIYKHCCGKDYVLKGGKVTASLGQSSAELKEVKRLLGAGSAPTATGELLATSYQTLTSASADLQQALAQRRSTALGTLETSVRGLEHDAQKLVADALSSHGVCQGYFRQGNADKALIACDASLTAVESAQAAFATTQAWLK